MTSEPLLDTSEYEPDDPEIGSEEWAKQEQEAADRAAAIWEIG